MSSESLELASIARLAAGMNAVRQVLPAGELGAVAGHTEQATTIMGRASIAGSDAASRSPRAIHRHDGRLSEAKPGF